MLRLAAPLALTELGWLAMSFTDTVMVGRLPDSATAIGAVSLGSTLVLYHWNLWQRNHAGHGHAGGAGLWRGPAGRVPSHHVERSLSGMHSLADFDGVPFWYFFRCLAI